MIKNSNETHIQTASCLVSGPTKKRGRPKLSDEQKAQIRLRRQDAEVARYGLMPGSALVKKPVVQALFCISPATLYRKLKQGLFPRPVVQTGRFTAWRKQDLDDHLNSLAAA